MNQYEPWGGYPENDYLDNLLYDPANAAPMIGPIISDEFFNKQEQEINIEESSDSAFNSDYSDCSDSF